MRKSYNLYCDESSHLINDHMPFMLLSYIRTPLNQLSLHKKQISELKRDHGYKGEIKWSKVSKSQYEFYKDLIDYFFATDLLFRTIVVDKASIKMDEIGFDFDKFYFKMYFQLLHHKLSMDATYNIYLDIKDTRSHKKVKKLEKILSYNSAINRVQTIRAYESSLMQLADFIMGAINYKLRGLDKVKAKNDIIRRIENKCGSSLSQPSPWSFDKVNRFFIQLR